MATRCRRSHGRYSLQDHVEGELSFRYPQGGHPCVMPLRDISRSGLSFVLVHELPGLDVGDSIDGAQLRIGRHEIRGDLLVMRLNPDASSGSVCGALFYPAEDEDILALRASLAELEAADAARQGLVLGP